MLLTMAFPEYVVVQLLSPVGLFWDPMDCSIGVGLHLEYWSGEYWSGSAFPSPGDLPDPGI